MLTSAQVEQYRELGYLVVPDVLGRELLAEVKRRVDAIVAEAAKVTAHTEVYDLEDSHSAQEPRVRRIKTPHKHFPFFTELTRNPRITSILAQLIGPNIRLHGSKLNMKSAGYGAPVEWHQDWAFYPHTNDDILATGIYLDDCDAANGPMCVVAGTHTGPVYDHHANGYFCGAIDPELSDAGYAKAVPLMGQAGSMNHPPRPPGARLGAQHLGQAAPAAAARIRRRRCLAAHGRRQFRRVQQPHRARPADDRAARHAGAGAHAAAARAVPGLDLRESEGGGEAVLRDRGGVIVGRISLTESEGRSNPD